jgi:hypothetical protein
MIVDRAWAERNLGFDPSARARAHVNLVGAVTRKFGDCDY